jgi:cell wall assembly regulator SMI1
MNRVTLPVLLERLKRLLPVHEPDVWASLRDPVSERALYELAAVVAPHPLPGEFVELLRWHDGQADVWWPLMACGPLLGAAQAAHTYTLQRDDEVWHPSWLPIAAEGWYIVGIEMTGEYEGLLIEASSPEMPHPLAPSLTAMLHATCDVLEAGIRAESVDIDGDEQASRERNAIAEGRYVEYGGLPPTDSFDPAW